MADPGTAIVVSSQESRSEENLLLDHVRRIERSRQGTYAVHIHLSKLHVRYLQPHYLPVAARAFDNISANFDVMLYMMSNSDMVLVCRETPSTTSTSLSRRSAQCFPKIPCPWARRAPSTIASPPGTT
jgi:hypothetical protein